MMPASWPALWRWWRRTTLTPRTIARFSFGIMVSISPCFPLSRPVRITTRSPFLNFKDGMASEHLRCERNYLHVVLGAQFTSDWSKDAGTNGFACLIDQHSRVTIGANE